MDNAQKHNYCNCNYSHQNLTPLFSLNLQISQIATLQKKRKIWLCGLENAAAISLTE
jgi:hypothetical protein